MAKLPILNFLDYEIRRLNIRARDDFEAVRPQKAQIQSGFTVARSPEEPQRFRLTLMCRIFRDDPAEKSVDDQNLAYDLDLEIHGEFWSVLQISPDTLPATLALNALMILYGVARGVVGQATGGGANGRMILPTVLLDDLVGRSTENPNSGVAPDSSVLGSPSNSKQEIDFTTGR